MGDKIMKKSISAIISLVMTAALFTQTMSITAVTVDTPVDIDKSIYDQLLDLNEGYDISSDGVISEEEFKNIQYIRINLDDVKDISGLEKAERLRRINLSGGSITDFSVLCGLKNLRIISINDNPVNDISYFKDMNLNFLYLEGTNVSVEDKISMIKAKDIEVPVGFAENFNIKPSGLFEIELVIEDNEIAGFGENGEARTYDNFYNDIIGKEPGETTYSVMNGGKEIAKGKIKVVPSEVKKPQSDLSGIKVDKIEEIHRDTKPIAGILTEDEKYYNYKDGNFVLVADNVKTVYTKHISGNYGEYILKNDGTFTIEGKHVFGDNTKVSEICGDYAITDDGSLWFITVSGNVIQKTKICSDCEKSQNERLVIKKDGTVILVLYSRQNNESDKATIYEIGKMNIVHVQDIDQFILDDQGNVWSLNTEDYYSVPDVKLIAKNAVKLGSIPPLSLSVYATAEGKVYSCYGGEEIKTVKPQHIVVKDGYNYSMLGTSPYVREDYYDFMDEATVAGVEICNDDRIYGRSVLYRDKTLYMTCLGRHIAISDVKQSYGAYYDKAANDYSILIVRNDNTLWEYRIGADTLTQVTDDTVKSEEPKVTEAPVTTTKAPVTTTVKQVTPTKATQTTTTLPEEKLSVADVISLIRYMTGGSNLTDSQIKKYDMNADGKINLLDVILMKNKIVGDNK